MKIKLKRRKGTNKKQNNQNLRKFGERLNVFFSDRKNVAVTSLFVIIIVIASVCGVVGWKKVTGHCRAASFGQAEARLSGRKQTY